MAGRRTRWAVAIGIFLCLPPALLVFAASLIQPDRYKPRIEALVAAQTGRTLSIDGPIRIRWALHPALSFSRIRLSNLPGGSRPDMAIVDRIDARLSVLALLHWRIAVTRLTLIGPNILFEPVNGAPNWVFRRAAAAPDHATKAPGLSIETAHVTNGMLTFHFPRRTNVIGVRSLDYAHVRWTDPLRLDAVFVYRDFKPFSFRAAATPTGNTFAPWTTQIEAHAFDESLAADGSASLSGAYDLTVKLRAPALEQLNQLLPSLRLPPLHGMVLSTRLINAAAGDLPDAGKTDMTADSLSLDDHVPGLSLSKLHLSLPAQGAVARFGAGGRFRTQPFTIDGQFDLPIHLDGRSTGKAGLTITAGRDDSVHPGDRLHLEGSLSLNSGTFDGFAGQASLRSATLAAFRPLVSPALPVLTALSVESGIALPASLDRVDLRSLSLHAAEGDLAGDVLLRRGRTPSVTATLHSGLLSLDPLLPAGAGKDDTPSMQTRLPWDRLRQNAALDIAWRADRIDWHGQTWPALALHATLDRGMLSLDMPDGALRGTASVNAGVDPVPVRLSMRTHDFPLRPLLGLAGLPMPANDPVTGTLRLALDLSARGDTPQALLSSLDGTVAMATNNAGMSYNTLSAVAASALDKLGARAPRGNHTIVRRFGLRGTVADGVLKLSTLALDTGSLVLSGVGTVDLVQKTLALKLHPLARLAGSRVSVPVVVKGPFAAPAISVDAGGLDKVGLLLDALFGGDHPKTCKDAGLKEE
ncbi:AsmA family protein [Acetobacteraceae bacterium KSS8]|uniref:AsmA family protein n=1 Tax=Endosaccharibacter trunci TaxID=2812733 RepID=A0ABT1W6K2_9PROT|nr:AsmA family protein [Acetobacteraceae bacterium KSS8]